MDDSLHLLPGFRFHPTDEEIITHYLLEKVIDQSFKSIAIGEGSFNECEPWDLPGKANMGEKEWYFFCKRDRKYPTGMRTNRATSTGYWKATGKDKEIFKGKGVLVGMKKTLVFYSGRAPRGMKTKWVMHEYRLEGKYQYNNFSTPHQDEWVVCKVYNKKDTKISTGQQEVAERMNSSFVDDLLVDNPDQLLPLTNSPFFYNSRNNDIKEEADGQENEFIQSFLSMRPEKQIFNHFQQEEAMLGASSDSNGDSLSLRGVGAKIEKVSYSNSNSNSVFSASMDTGRSSERNMEEIGSFQSYENHLSPCVEQVDFDGIWNNGLI
ncbi:hypothetical protein IEQ34_009934 [Dendrobium chrysotoxum]|uniref:NAC domain-containing protein n=1 Tax=Dendrobium chrysotoxum TaxID=161865 RepID=A0AAV7GKS8_DENCH|nr:hypothetical protein IEQ34_009934 [Dendrobium chrysotoxum]